MKELWKNLWPKIGRMGRKDFFKKHLYIILFAVILSFVGGVCRPILGLIGLVAIRLLYCVYLSIPLIIIFSSNLFLAKRFQDCGICGIRAFVLGIIIIITLFMIIFAGDYLEKSLDNLPFILSLPLTLILSALPFLWILYPILLIVMCFKKGNPGPNKYGNPV